MTENDVYSYTARALDGSEVKLDKYKGDVLLIVNTASKCGFTPQFEGLEKLHKDYSARGLKVLGFPCNQFGNQDPGDNAEIGAFCQHNYGVDFQMFEKIEVNGQHAHPLFNYLKKRSPGLLVPDIKWNFTKFLVDRSGNEIKRYAPAVTPEELKHDIEEMLK
jgi:glutathione peroxidase